MVALLSAAPSAHAEPTPEERALAASLFQDAKEAMRTERFADACPKLEESQRLDPGGGTLLNLALCHEKVGRVASAWAEYREALAIARREGRASRIALATERIAALEPEVPHVRVMVPEGARIPELAVAIDDRTELRAAAWGTAVPIDPGPHTLVAKAKGRVPWTTPFEVAMGQTVEVAIPLLAKDAPPPTPLPPASAPPAARRATPERTDDAAPLRLGGFARLDVDARLRGAAAALGPELLVADRLVFSGGARLGPSVGGELSASAFLLGGAWRPRVGLVAPLYVVDGPRLGVGARGGLAWEATPLVGASIGVEIDWFPRPPESFEGWLFAPSLGAHARF